ncbi:hypothetical protein [Streptomyces sp. AC495_CC817]|uniref:hypothetical protein n=1 Tax=Streptomyces sp. AC495_CC817 TaxID=2823900 RepID=UPI001C27AB51|nr:hypothetical protein [Streptomyces sp. AC495_CC817]
MGAEIEDLPDYLGDAKRHKEWVNEDPFRRDRLAGALIETVCPRCTLTIGAFVRNTDTPWLDLVCPACDFEFTERDGVLETSP